MDNFKKAIETLAATLAALSIAGVAVWFFMSPQIGAIAQEKINMSIQPLKEEHNNFATKESIENTKEGISLLRQEMATLRSEVALMRSDIKNHQTAINEQYASLSRDIGEIKGALGVKQ